MESEDKAKVAWKEKRELAHQSGGSVRGTDSLHGGREGGSRELACREANVVVWEVGSEFGGVESRVHAEVGGKGNVVVGGGRKCGCDGERAKESRQELASHRRWESEAFSIHVNAVANGELSGIWKAMLVCLCRHAEPRANDRV